VFHCVRFDRLGRTRREPGVRPASASEQLSEGRGMPTRPQYPPASGGSSPSTTADVSSEIFPGGAFHLLLLAFVPLTEGRSMLPPARKPTSETWSDLLTPPPMYHPSREQTVRRTTAMKCIRGLSERSL